MLLMMWGLGVLAVVAVGYVLTYVAFLKKVGPNEVLVVSSVSGFGLKSARVVYHQQLDSGQNAIGVVFDDSLNSRSPVRVA